MYLTSRIENVRKYLQKKVHKKFELDKTFTSQCKLNFKSVEGQLYKCFRKIGVGKRIENTEIQELLDETG